MSDVISVVGRFIHNLFPFNRPDHKFDSSSQSSMRSGESFFTRKGAHVIAGARIAAPVVRALALEGATATQAGPRYRLLRLVEHVP